MTRQMHFRTGAVEAQHVGSCQLVLEEELTRLSRLSPFAETLAVCWKPLLNRRVSGEVLGNTIYVYEQELEEAISILRHEYLDCLLTRKIINPLIRIVNAFIKLKENEVYKEKERIIANLLKLM